MVGVVHTLMTALRVPASGMPRKVGTMVTDSVLVSLVTPPSLPPEAKDLRELAALSPMIASIPALRVSVEAIEH